MLVNINDQHLQRLQNIASMRGISLEEALKKCITQTYYFSSKRFEGYKILLNKDSEVKEVIGV